MSYDLAIPLPFSLSRRNESLCLHKNLHMNVRNSIICNSQKPETTQNSINKWMDKQTVRYPFRGMLLSNNEEGATDKSYKVNRELAQFLWGKEARQQRLHTVWFHLYKILENATKTSDRKQIEGQSWVGGKDFAGHEENLVVMIMFTFLIIVMASRMYTLTSKQIAQFKYMHFIICHLYLSKAA